MSKQKSLIEQLNELANEVLPSEEIGFRPFEVKYDFNQFTFFKDEGEAISLDPVVSPFIKNISAGGLTTQNSSLCRMFLSYSEASKFINEDESLKSWFDVNRYELCKFLGKVYENPERVKLTYKNSFNEFFRPMKNAAGFEFRILAEYIDEDNGTE